MVVIHIDMDYFFGACEELKHPEFRGKPLVVGTATEKDKLKGVVETANYEARKFGIKSGMPTSQAYRLCDDIIYVQENYDYYDSMSKKILAIISEYKFPVEQMSIDEFGIDLKKIDYDSASKIAKEIKKRINSETGLPCTIGISYGKIFAKMACDDAKPDGFKIVKEEEIKAFLKDKDVKKLPGIGKKTEKRLHEMGINTIGSLAKASPLILLDHFGSFGKEMFELANGIDYSKIVEKYNILSIGRESTLDSPTGNIEKIEAKLKELSEEVKKEIDKNKFSFKTVSVKIKYRDFSEVIRSKSFPHYSNSLEFMKKVAHELVLPLVKDKLVRKVGIRVANFSGGLGQRKLFED